MHVKIYQRFLSNMAIELGCIVFSPEYRLAPEHPFPQGDMDAYQSTLHIFENSKTYKINRFVTQSTFMLWMLWLQLPCYLKNIEKSKNVLTYTTQNGDRGVR